MAWRIHESVIRGEIDNRQRGIVRGRVWLEGVEQPVALELQGNAAPDLAGCLLQFENPGKRIPMGKDAHLAQMQRGTVGDLTASRKVRVLELPVQEAYMRKKQGLPVPEHMANSIYLEWFSECNGRVVIESADYTITISPPSWRLTPSEENDRQKQSAEGFHGFMQKLTDALENQRHSPRQDKEWDEFDYEKFMRECDARTDKYSELLDKYRDHPDRDEIIAKEMGWNKAAKDKTGETDPFAIEPASEADDDPTELEDRESSLDEELSDELDEVPDLEPDPTTEGVDWVRRQDGFITHPLALRVMDGTIALWQQYEKLKLHNTEDEDLTTLLNEYQITGAKLGGALDGLAYGRELVEGPFIVACLKRALTHLHAAQAALEKVATKKLLLDELIGFLRTELFAVREEILRLMDEFRGEFPS